MPLHTSECDVDALIDGKRLAGVSFRERLLDLASEHEQMENAYLTLAERLRTQQVDLAAAREENDMFVRVESPGLQSELSSNVTGDAPIEKISQITRTNSGPLRSRSGDVQDALLSAQGRFDHELEFHPQKTRHSKNSSGDSHMLGVLASVAQKATPQNSGGESGQSHAASKLSFTQVVPAVWKRFTQAGSPNRLDDEEATIRKQFAQGFGDDNHDCGVLLPASRTRVAWDMIICFALLFELWTTPFELIFCEASAVPHTFAVLANTITCIFATDILLNFNTGYFEKDRTIMSRRAIARDYLKFWFWMDMLSTVPFDLLISSVGGGILKWVRFGKATKLLKTLRYLKLVRSVRLIRSMSQTGYIQELSARIRWGGAPAKLLIGLCIHAHCHGCIWAVMQPSWLPASSFSEATQSYFDAFYWGFTGMTAGSLKFPGNQHKESPSKLPLGCWIMELVIAYERVCFAAMVVVWGVFQALTRLQDHIRLTKIKEDAMAYLKRHEASFTSQVQVLYILHETGMVRQRQRHFRDLMDNDLPLEVKRKISIELWSVRLRSLGLIEVVRQENDSFLVELALAVREEVFASRAIIFRFGDASIASYCVLDGTLRAISDDNDPIPEFTVGHWISETALINPSLKRSFTVMTLNIVSLMAVPADGFQDLLTRLGLTSHFQHICAQYLWKGLCGRCGVLGDHYADSCPAMVSQNFQDRPSGRVAHLERYPSSENSDEFATNAAAHTISLRSSLAAIGGSLSLSPKKKAAPEDVIHGDLQHFLNAHGLTRVLPVLSQMGIRSLKDLEDVDLGAFKRELTLAGQGLTEEEERALSQKYISEFHLRAARTVHRTLFSLKERDSHYIFLSHSKMEAGTEAVLMRTELENLLQQDSEVSASNLEAPVFLDSEDLRNLKGVQAGVLRSHNLVVLLTSQVLTRPWVLVEIVTAIRNRIPVVPVNVVKPGGEFQFPGESLYDQISQGKFLSAEGWKILEEAEFSNKDVEKALRETFRQIAVPYSPHRNNDVRQAELKTLLKRCSIRCNDQIRDASPSSSPTHSSPHGRSPRKPASEGGLSF